MNLKKLGKILFLLVLISSLVLACSPAPVVEETAPQDVVLESAQEIEAEPELMVFHDDMKNKLEFTEYPNAIVSLAPSATELLFVVGAGDQVVGRDDFSLYPEEAMQIASIGSMFGELPTETILALEPDLVLAAQTISPEVVAALQGLDIQVYWQQNPNTFEDLYENMRAVAALTGHQDLAEALIEDLDARVVAVQDTIRDAETSPSVFYELDGTDPSNPWTTGSGTFIDYIINMAGGVNAAVELQGDYAQMSAEALIAADADVILLGDALFGMTVENVKARAGWDAITAVRDGAVYPFNPDILSIPGPRLVEGLEEMAMLIHPELFN